MNGRQDPILRAGLNAWRRALTALAAGLALAGGAAAERCNLTSLEIPVRVVNSRPVATLTLDGAEVSMLVDTGAFFSMLTDSTATQLQLKRRALPPNFTVSGYAGKVEASLATVGKVVLQGSALRNVDFIVGGNELGSGIGGILGRNFLSMTDVEFDLAHGAVRLMLPKGDCEKTGFAYWAGETPVIEAPLEYSVREFHPGIRILVQVNDTKVHALLDSGAPHTSLRLRAARRAGIEDRDMQPIGSVGGAGAGRVRSWTAQLRTFELGGEKILNNRFAIDDVSGVEQDMLIGLDYFLSHRIYVSWKQKRLYATWNGGPVFAKSWDGIASDARHAGAPPEIAPDDADALARRGEAALARRDPARALEDLNRACELAPKNAGYLLVRARVRGALKQYEQAMADLDAALKLDAGLHEARIARASLLAHGDDPDGARLDLSILDVTLPANAHLRFDMADLYARMKRLPEALRQWELWMATHRNDAGLAQALNSRCWLRARLGVELPQALDDCKEAVSMARSEYSFHDSLGWTYLRMGDAARSIAEFDKAIELKPSSAWSLYGRGLAKRRQGQAEAAEGDLSAARQQRGTIDEDVKEAGFLAADGVAMAPSSPR